MNTLEGIENLIQSLKVNKKYNDESFQKAIKFTALMDKMLRDFNDVFQFQLHNMDDDMQDKMYGEEKEESNEFFKWLKSIEEELFDKFVENVDDEKFDPKVLLMKYRNNYFKNRYNVVI